MPTPYVICLTTAPSLRKGEEIAKKIVQKRLAACVNVLSEAVSFYRWKGQFFRDKEFVLLMKTRASKTALLEKEVSKIHPYELPEFVVLPILKGSRRYLKWIDQNLKA